MNPYRKSTNFHLTYKGHYILDLPYESVILAYCHEGPDTGANTEHTHVVLKTLDLISKHDIINDV